jgi:hypothetical protein
MKWTNTIWSSFAMSFAFPRGEENCSGRHRGFAVTAWGCGNGGPANEACCCVRRRDRPFLRKACT